MTDNPSIELYQSITVEGSKAVLDAFRAALIAGVRDPWRLYEPERKASPIGFEELLVFEQAETPERQAVRVSFYRKDDAYGLANVTPVKIGQLTRGQYNAIATEFSNLFARPAAEDAGATFQLSEPTVTMEVSLGPVAAAALRRFSAAANQSNAAAHPSDHERLLDAIIALKGQEIETGALARFLTQLHWPSEIAEELASRIAFGVELLARNERQ